MDRLFAPLSRTISQSRWWSSPAALSFIKPSSLYPSGDLIIDDGESSLWSLANHRGLSERQDFYSSYKIDRGYGLGYQDPLSAGSESLGLTGAMLNQQIVARGTKHYENARTLLGRGDLEAAKVEAKASVALLKGNKNQELLDKILKAISAQAQPK